LLLRRHRALTQVCRSGSDLGSRGTTATATQLTMDMGIIRMDIIDHIRITGTTQDLRSIGPAAIESTTAAIVTITTGIGTKLT
jgi:hypothetical protein